MAVSGLVEPAYWEITCLVMDKRDALCICVCIYNSFQVLKLVIIYSICLINRCIDQAVLLSKDLGDYRDVVQLAERACNLYQQHGSPDSASIALDKAAKLLEQHHPDQALRLYQRAADVVLVCN